MIKIAMLGCDKSSLALVQAALTDGQNLLIEIYGAAEYQEPLRRIAPQAVWRDDWESLLLGDGPDLLIVASSPQTDLRADQLRKLVQQAIPLALIHPACEAIIAYELDMIRHDTECLMLTYYPGLRHPAISRLSELISPSADKQNDLPSIGNVEQLVLQRGMNDRRDSIVWEQLARDAEMIRHLVGDIDQVSAMGTPLEDESTANLSVQMTGSAGILARWSVTPAGQSEESSLVLLGSAGKASLSMPADESQWSLKIVCGDQIQTLHWVDESGPSEAWNALSQQFDKSQPRPFWSEVCHSLEIASSAQQSLRRRRTIPIYHQEHSERQTFKGLMAAGGCGALMLALLGVMVAVVIDSLQPPFRDHLWWRLWPVYLFALLGFFLLLQLLQLFFHRDSVPEQKEEEASSADSAI